MSTILVDDERIRGVLRISLATRGWSPVPIIALSERDDADEKVRALDVGADDYLTTPFGINELLARVRAALRRAVTPSIGPPSIVDAGSFTVDLHRKKVGARASKFVSAPTEWALLEVLVRHAGRLVTQRELLETVWGPGHRRHTHYLRVYMGQLRRKLEPTPAPPRHLMTEPGTGYRSTVTRGRLGRTRCWRPTFMRFLNARNL